MKKTVLSLILLVLIIGVLGCSSKPAEGETDEKNDSGVTIEQQDNQGTTDVKEALGELGKEIGVDDLLDATMALEMVKYVDKSRLATDKQNYSELRQILMTTIIGVGPTLPEMPKNYVFTMTNDGLLITHNGEAVGQDDAFVNELAQFALGGDLSFYKSKCKDSKYIIEVDENSNIVETLKPEE